jgi:hypothetical protein
VRALVSGRRRGGQAIWEVNTFLATDEEPMAGPALLGQLTAAAQRAGAHRVILRVAEDSPAVGAALDAGFVPYAREQTFVREEPPAVTVTTEPAGFRPREDSDDEALFRLYSETVPAGRRAHEAATPEQWRALHERDGTRASREFVTEEDNGRLSAWLRVAREGKALRFMPMLLHSGRAADVDSLVAASLGSLSGGAEGPIVALVPEYIGGVGPALAAGGFVEDMTYVSLVCRVMREVAVAETAPGLAPAAVEAAPAQPVSVASTIKAHS